MMRRGRTLISRLGDERGMALVMAIGVAMVLSIAGASLILYGTSNQNAANRSKATHDAYQLAVSGIENAVSQLAQAGSADPTSLDDYLLLANTAGGFCNTVSNCTQTFDTNESVVWHGLLCDDRTTPATCPYTSAPSDTYIPRLRWALTSTSTIPNPNGTGTIARTVTADVQLRPQTQITRDDEAWSYVYSWKTGDPDGCDMELPNNPDVQSSFYVAGNFCLDNNSSIVGPTGSNPAVKVNIRGNAILKKSGNDLGTNARPLTNLYVEGALGCKYRTGDPAVPYPHYSYWCQDGSPAPEWDSHVRPESQRGSAAVAVPVAQFDDWYYTASPGPAFPCDPDLSSGAYPDFTDDGVANNGDKGTLALPYMSSFSCKTMTGELTWDATAHTLKIDGTVFWDGNMEFDPPVQTNVTYDGAGALYLSGWYRMRQTRICSTFTSGGDCNYSTWDTAADILFIATMGSHNWSQCNACGVVMEQSSQFQGALYADYSMGFQNNSYVQGPMVSKEELIQNSFTFNYIPPLVKVPFGAPSVTIKAWDMLPPSNYTG